MWRLRQVQCLPPLKYYISIHKVDNMQITKQDFMPLIEALDSIKVSGSKDIGTMNNVFGYIEMLMSKAEQKEEDKDGDKVQD